MANDLAILKSFVDGQGAGAATYTTYAEDHDSNYTDIENNFNTLNAEVKAFAGQNATLVLDLLRSITAPVVSAGVVDVTSFAPVVFISGDTQMQIPVGVALTSSGRVELLSTSTLTGSGAGGTRWVALQADGTVTLETASGQGIMDLYSITWAGAVFTTATLLLLQDILVGGHDLQNMKIQEDFGQGSDTAIPAYTYDRIADRLHDIVRILGYDLASADAGQAALNPIAVGGAVAGAGLIAGDGATYEPTTGIFMNPTLNSVGVTILATQAMLWDETVVNEPQSILRNGSALATPPLCFATDLNTGLGWVAADHFRAIVNAAAAMEWDMDGTDPKALFVAGSAATVPGLAVIGDINTGLGGSGSDVLRLISGGVLGMELQAQQQINSATQGRVRATRASLSLTNSGTLTNITFDVEDFDQGGWFAATSADFTMPAGFTGPCMISGEIEWPAGNLDGIRHIALEVAGAAVQQVRVSPATAGVTILNVSVVAFDVTAAQVIRLQGAHTDTSGALNIRASIEISRIVA